MIPPDAGYFERASDRRLAQAHESGATALSEELAKAAKNGLIGNSRLILLLNDRLLAIYEVELREFGKFLFEAAGAVTSKSVASVRAHATAVRTDFLDLHRKKHTRSGVGGEFDQRMATTCDSILDDFAHGLIGGIRLSKDPIVKIVSTITNSPGATQQSGFGHLNQSVTQQQ